MQALEKIWKEILRRKPLSLWTIPALLLWLASVPYRFVPGIARRRMKDRVRVALPVISVGNITVGGTGKTPMVHLLGRHLSEEGFRVGIVSSGYGRESEDSFVEPGYRVRGMSAAETGDEVMLLAMLLPDAVFSVAGVKTDAAMALADSGLVDVIIVDDGFQHYRLHRDLDIVTYDAAIPRRLMKPFPGGVMRERRVSLRRADVVVITRSNFARDIGVLQKRLRKIAPKAAHYTAQFGVEELVGHDRRWPVKYIEDKSVFLFAGVGNFEPLRRQVSVLAGDLDDAAELSDHQEYDDDLLAELKAVADDHDSDVIVTTGKDWVKLGDFDFGREIYYLAQSVDLDPGEEQFVAWVQEKLGLRKEAD